MDAHKPVKVEAELATSIGEAQIVSIDFPIPVNYTFMDAGHFSIDLCLTPRPLDVRARYVDHWGPHRYERIGRVFAIPAGENMEYRSQSGRQASILCHLRPDCFETIFRREIPWTNRQLESCLNIGSQRMVSLLRALAREVLLPSPERQEMGELVQRQIVIELGRYLTAIDDPPEVGGLAAWRLKVIDERLEQIGKVPTLPELSVLCGLSVRQLTRAFRVSRGQSIGEYVAQSRIEMAKRLLVGTDSIKSVAFAMGFSSASSFTYTFQHIVGLTPRQFRALSPRVG